MKTMVAVKRSKSGGCPGPSEQVAPTAEQVSDQGPSASAEASDGCCAGPSSCELSLQNKCLLKRERVNSCKGSMMDGPKVDCSQPSKVGCNYMRSRDRKRPCYSRVKTRAVVPCPHRKKDINIVPSRPGVVVASSSSRVPRRRSPSSEQPCRFLGEFISDIFVFVPCRHLFLDFVNRAFGIEQ